MPGLRRYVVIATFLMTVAACSGEGQPPEPQRPGSAAPASTRASAFCLDLGLLQLAITVFRAQAGEALEGEPLDFKELRRQADNIARIGRPMRADAPADIRQDLIAVLAAVAAAKTKLKPAGAPGNCWIRCTERRPVPPSRR